MRSGHESKNICAAFEYMHAIKSIPQLVAVAGKIFSLYSDPTKKVHLSKLVFVNESNMVRIIYNFIVDVFSIDQHYLLPRGRLRPYTQALFAFFIMHWTQFYHECGASNIIIVFWLNQLATI